MAQISRRTVAKGAGWTAPALMVGAAAPAHAVSCPTKTPIYKWSYTPNTFAVAGSTGYLNTVSFWVTVAYTAQPSPMPKCSTYVDNSTTPMVMNVAVKRVSGSTSRYRSVTLAQEDSVTTVTKTHDTASDSTHPVGGTDYSWTVTFLPTDVYNLNAQHRFYVTLHPGDGGIIGGRITNSLVVDGTTRISAF